MYFGSAPKDSEWKHSDTSFIHSVDGEDICLQQSLNSLVYFFCFMLSYLSGTSKLCSKILKTLSPWSQMNNDFEEVFPKKIGSFYKWICENKRTVVNVTAWVGWVIEKEKCQWKYQRRQVGTAFTRDMYQTDGEPR